MLLALPETMRQHLQALLMRCPEFGSMQYEDVRGLFSGPGLQEYQSGLPFASRLDLWVSRTISYLHECRLNLVGERVLALFVETLAERQSNPALKGELQAAWQQLIEGLKPQVPASAALKESPPELSSRPPAPKLEPAQLRLALARQLEGCPTFGNPRARPVLLATLPAHYQSHLPNPLPTNLSEIVAIVQALQNFENGLTVLVNTVLHFDSEVEAGRQLRQFALSQGLI